MGKVISFQYQVTTTPFPGCLVVELHNRDGRMHRNTMSVSLVKCSNDESKGGGMLHPRVAGASCCFYLGIPLTFSHPKCTFLREKPYWLQFERKTAGRAPSPKKSHWAHFHSQSATNTTTALQLILIIFMIIQDKILCWRQKKE